MLLAATLLVVGCPDDAGTGNGDTNGTPTEATQVQSATIDANTRSAQSVTLNWDLPTDTDGLLGFTVSEENNAGSLLTAQEVDQNTTEYEVTGLEPATEYEFTIATRYSDSGKNNSTTVTGTTLGIPTAATKVQNATSGAITINTITLNWALPTDIVGLVGFTVSAENNAGNLAEPVEVDQNTTEYEVTGLEPATEYEFTIATRYSDSGKNNSTTIMATTAVATAVQGVMLVNGATTSDSVTITWGNPADMEGYSGVTISIAATAGDLTMDTPRMVDANTNTLTISELTAATSYAFTLTFVPQYDDQDKGSSSDHIIMVMTQSNVVTGVTASDITGTSITLTWTPPEDSGSDYEGVSITAPTAMPAIAEIIVDIPETTATISDLTLFTAYEFIITTRYSDATKLGGMSFTGTITTPSNPIDTDGDALVDINSLERLDNMRYNLDLGTAGDDGRYKESTQTAPNAGTLCGERADDPCTGYELTRSLDFAANSSYEGSINTNWRPNNANPDTATNGGWTPIGDDFASRFEGNGYTISNLYSRNHQNGGLFSITIDTAVIRSIGIASAHVYGRASGNDNIGTLVGVNNGIIVASYASGGTVDAGAGQDEWVGGLVGFNNSLSTIVASYASGGTVRVSSGNSNNIGGLVGGNSWFIIASYASSSAAGGTGTSGRVGGLAGYNVFPSTRGNIIASYATGTAAGGAGASDRVGGLVGDNNQALISASYATGDADGEADGSDNGGALVGARSSDTITASYGFGSATAETIEMTGAPPSGATAAAHLTAPDPTGSTDTAVDATWNAADSTTLNAWDFGDNMQAPALRYADYDGAGNDTYGCGDDSTATIVIPSVVATPAGPMGITCGSTLLPGQEGR